MYLLGAKLNPVQRSARLMYGAEKVAYEAEDFHRVVACTGSFASLCEAADGDGPYTSAVVP